MAKVKSGLKGRFYFGKYEDMAELEKVTQADFGRSLQGFALAKEFAVSPEEIGEIGALEQFPSGKLFIYVSEEKYKSLKNGITPAELFKGVIEEDPLTLERRRMADLEAKLAKLEAENKKLLKENGSKKAEKEKPDQENSAQV